MKNKNNNIARFGMNERKEINKQQWERNKELIGSIIETVGLVKSHELITGSFELGENVVEYRISTTNSGHDPFKIRQNEFTIDVIIVGEYKNNNDELDIFKSRYLMYINKETRYVKVADAGLNEWRELSPNTIGKLLERIGTQCSAFLKAKNPEVTA